MKRVEVDKTVGKAIVVTVIFLCIIFGAWLVQEGYSNGLQALATQYVVIAISSVCVVASIVFIVLGLMKDIKYCKWASYFAALAVFAILLHIDWLVKPLAVSINGRVVAFHSASVYVICAGIIGYWIYTVVKIAKN